MRRMCWLLALTLLAGAAHAATVPIKFGLFGTVHTIVPGTMRAFVS